MSIEQMVAEIHEMLVKRPDPERLVALKDLAKDHRQTSYLKTKCEELHIPVVKERATVLIRRKHVDALLLKANKDVKESVQKKIIQLDKEYRIAG